MKGFSISQQFKGEIKYRVTNDCESILGVAGTKVSPVIFEYNIRQGTLVSTALNLNHVFESYGFSIKNKKIKILAGLDKDHNLAVIDVSDPL